jgi:RNA polymerase sigma-70 factor (ECF subfamily)
VQNEEQLVERAKQRDQEAFAQLYEEYFDRIYRYIVFKIGDETEAEDMTQQVFLKALRSISSFRWKGVSFSAWLFRIAHKQIVDYMRRKAKRFAVPLNESIVSGDDDPQKVTEQRADIEQVLAAAKHLTKAQREVVSLRFAGDLSISEVARVMGRSVGAVKALQHSAVVALRKAMSY